MSLSIQLSDGPFQVISIAVVPPARWYRRLIILQLQLVDTAAIGTIVEIPNVGINIDFNSLILLIYIYYTWITFWISIKKY